jgi:tripartite-type tricarboxylate transporter receptor subunit TctC
MMRIVAAGIMAFGLTLSLAGPAPAQTYPDRLIRMIVPFPPGGPVDTMARIVTQGLPQILGQTVIIENRGGASGTIGGRFVAASPADGYTLLFGNISSLVVTPVVTNNRDFDPDKTFTAVAKTSQNYEVLVVHPDFPAKSVRELVAYAKANPGKLNFGSAGIGNATHLAAELFKQRTGVDIVHVPYKGAFEAVTGVMAGQVQMFFGDIGGVLPLIREGRVRALGISSPTRSADLPTLPTMIESGVPGYVVLTYTGVVAPAATPPEIVQKLNAALNASLQTPEAAAALRRIGAESVPSSAQDFAVFLSAERDKWREVVRVSGIKIE